jgi:hypothetical protein
MFINNNEQNISGSENNNIQKAEVQPPIMNKIYNELISHPTILLIIIILLITYYLYNWFLSYKGENMDNGKKKVKKIESTSVSQGDLEKETDNLIEELEEKQKDK